MRFMVALCLVAVPLAGAIAESGGHRQLGAHEHGSGQLNLAIEGNNVSMELIVPGNDIVGFEHAPTTKKQKAKVSNAKAILSNPLALFNFPSAADCKVKSAEVEYEVSAGHDDHKAKHGHGKKHSHASKKHGHEDDHASHAEFHATYALTCKAATKIDRIAFPYFKKFRGTKELDVSVISAKGQQKFAATAKKNSIVVK